MNKTWFPNDTSRDAAQVQLQIYRRMSFEKRLRLTLAMSQSLGKIAAAAIRMDRPELTDEQVRYVIIRRRLGVELFRKVFPGVNLPP